jgi:hypothetical protein
MRTFGAFPGFAGIVDLRRHCQLLSSSADWLAIGEAEGTSNAFIRCNTNITKNCEFWSLIITVALLGNNQNSVHTARAKLKTKIAFQRTCHISTRVHSALPLLPISNIAFVNPMLTSSTDTHIERERLQGMASDAAATNAPLQPPPSHPHQE